MWQSAAKLLSLMIWRRFNDYPWRGSRVQENSKLMAKKQFFDDIV
jgi:hypothetical protein